MYIKNRGGCTATVYIYLHSNKKECTTPRIVTWRDGNCIITVKLTCVSGFACAFSDYVQFCTTTDNYMYMYIVNREYKLLSYRYSIVQHRYKATSYLSSMPVIVHGKFMSTWNAFSKRPSLSICMYLLAWLVASRTEDRFEGMCILASNCRSHVTIASCREMSNVSIFLGLTQHKRTSTRTYTMYMYIHVEQRLLIHKDHNYHVHRYPPVEGISITVGSVSQSTCICMYLQCHIYMYM